MEPDPFAELERMASIANAANHEEPTSSEIARWMKLFKYDYLTASTLIAAHRSSITREPISDEHWELVREDREKAGYDREAYEHSLGLKDLWKSQSTTIHDKDGKAWVLFRLGGLLESEDKVREVAGLEEVPKVTLGVGSGERRGAANFVWVDLEAAKRVESWLEMRQIEVPERNEEEKAEGG